MIDKLDTTFTSTGKGLMWLFTIGLIHTVIGTSVIGNEIAIPTLPIIRIENPNYIYYLYWALVGYSIYRYFLHNKELFRDLNVESMSSQLTNTKLGKILINKYFNPKKDHSYNHSACNTISCGDSTPNNARPYFAFTLKLNPHKENSITKRTSYDIIYNNSLFPSQLQARGEYDFLKHNLEKYANYISETHTDSSLFYYDLKLLSKLIFSCVNFYMTFKRIFSDHEYFDLTLPIICNLSLFIFTLLNYFHS